MKTPGVEVKTSTASSLVARGGRFHGSTSFNVRLDLVLAHLPEARSADLRDLLDSFAADCLESSQLVVDLLGHQPNLAAALGTLGDLARGEGGGTGNNSLAKLRSLIGEGALPQTSATLWDRILRELNRGRSLSRTDEKEEWKVLMRLSDRLLAGCPPERKSIVQGAVKDRIRRLSDAAD